MTGIEKYKLEQYEKAKAGAQPTKPSSLQFINTYPSTAVTTHGVETVRGKHDLSRAGPTSLTNNNTFDPVV